MHAAACVPLCLCAALVTVPAAAAPTPATAELSWVRADGAEICSDAQALRTEVNRRLGRDAFTGVAVVSVEGVASRESAQWVAHIYARGLTGEALGSRTLRSDAADCESLSQAVALAIALVIDPEAVDRTARALPKPAAAQVVEDVPPPRPKPTPPASERPPAWVDARALASVGLLPGVAPGLAFGTQAPILDWLSAAVDLNFWPEQETEKLASRYAFGLTAVSLGLCAEPFTSAQVGLLLCGAGWLGSIHAVVFDLQPTAPGDRVWTAASAQLRLYVPLGPLRISLGLLAATPFTRHRFVATGRDQTIFQQAVVVGSADLGLGLRF